MRIRQRWRRPEVEEAVSMVGRDDHHHHDSCSVVKFQTQEPFQAHRCRSRRRQCPLGLYHHDHHGSWFRLLLLVQLLLISYDVAVSAAPFDACLEELLAADTTGDGQLDESEFATVVAALSNNAVTTLNNGDEDLTATYDSSIDGVNWSDETATSDSDTTATACRSIYQSILATLQMDAVSSQICSVGLMVGDANRDNLLAADYEYIRFVNYLSGGDYASVTDFGALSAALQQVHAGFASDSQIDVTGSKPGETPTDDQEVFLQDLCDQVVVAIHTGEGDANDDGATDAPVASSTTTITTNAPTTSPGEAVTDDDNGGDTGDKDNYEETFTFSTCTTSLAFSDLTRNGILESNEYVRFLNRLTSNAYYADTYDTLPATLQENFVALTDNDDNGAADGIDITGSAPGSSATDEELAHLQEVCQATDISIQAAAGGGDEESTESPAATPTAATPATPTVAPTVAATSSAIEIALEFTRCTQFLAISDLDRDNSLSDTEYLRFLTYASARAISPTDYNELDPVLQSNYEALTTSSDNGLIDIGGSKPGETPTAEQEAHLTEVCESTVEAMNDVLNPEEQTPPTPPTNAVNTTVYNAWIVSDPTGSLTAISLRTGQNREALDQGYAAFVQDQFRIFLEGAGSSGGRYLQAATADGSSAVYLADGSAQNYELVDYDPCPEFPSGEPATGNCIKVFSSFIISTVNIDNTAIVSDQLMQQTMGNIPKDLQSHITDVFAATPLIVVNGDLPLQPVAEEPVPDDDDGDEEVADESSKPSAGAIAGSVIVILLIVCCLGGAIYSVWKKKVTCEDVMVWLPDIPGLSKRDRKDEDADKTADIEKAAYGDDDDDYDFGAAPSPKENEDIDFKYGDDDESGGFSVMDQDPSQSGHEDEDAPGGAGKGNKFKFKLGKKKTAAGTFDGAIGDMGVDAFNDAAANDFADYGFDDPVAGIANADDIFGRKGDTGFDNAWGNGGRTGGSATGEQFSKASRSRRSGDDDDSGSSSESGSDDESLDDDDDDEEQANFGKEPNFATADMPDNMRHLDAMVDQGNWDGVMAAATKIDTDLTDGDRSETSRPSLQESEGLSHTEGSDNSSTSPKPVLYDPDRSRDDNSAGDSFVSYSSEELRRRAQYRGQVEALVKKVVPDEIEKIDSMLDQFSGREAELIRTLQTMEERSATQRARKAVHKSKAMPQRENIPFGPGGTEGSAAIAAASTIGVQVGTFDDAGGFTNGENFGFGGQNAAFDDTGSYSKSGSHSGSYSDNRSQSDSRSGSYSRSQQSGSRSYYSDEQSGTGSRSYYSDEKSAASGSVATGSQYSGSQTGSHQSGSYRSGEDEGSYVSGEGSRSYVSGADSRTESYASGSQRSGSYHSGDDQGSYVSGDGSRSYKSGEDSQTGSYRSGEGSQTGSYRSGDESRSHRSGEEGSYVSGEGSRSYRSGEDEGSYVSGEGSRSYRSGEGEGSYVSGEGSQSYRSGEDEGSYISGDGSRSRRTGEDEGSYVSGKGSRSYRSGDEDERSYVSGEGSQSYRSGDGEASYVSGDASQSYRSGEDDDASYVSGEGSQSYRSGDDGSQTGSYQSGSYVSGDGSRSRSSYSGDDD